MRKKWNVILGTFLLIVACLCMSACTATDDGDEQKDKVNTEQDVNDDNNVPDTEDTEDVGSSMPETEEYDDDYNWEEESDGTLIEDPEEELIPEDDLSEESEEEIIPEDLEG